MKPAGRLMLFVAVEIVRFPSNTEPKVARSEVPLPEKSAAANDCAEGALMLRPAANVRSPLPVKIVT